MNIIFGLIMLGMAVTLAVAARNIQVANRKPKRGLEDWRDWQKGMFK